MTKSKIYYDRKIEMAKQAAKWGQSYTWYLRYVHQRLTLVYYARQIVFMTKISMGLLTNFSNEGGVAHPWLLSKA
jgi:hypothetical protein